MTDAEDRREAELRKLAGHTSEFAFLLRRLDEVRERARAAEDECRMLSEQVRALAEALSDARNNGLIYWEPQTARGAINKALMLNRLDALLKIGTGGQAR